MPYLETPEELSASIADMVGVWGAGPENDQHPDGCGCRLCFEEDINRRIRLSVANEKTIYPSKERV